jgi:hypothetical protein
MQPISYIWSDLGLQIIQTKGGHGRSDPDELADLLAKCSGLNV